MSNVHYEYTDPPKPSVKRFRDLEIGDWFVLHPSKRGTYGLNYPKIKVSEAKLVDVANGVLEPVSDPNTLSWMRLDAKILLWPAEGVDEL